VIITFKSSTIKVLLVAVLNTLIPKVLKSIHRQLWLHTCGMRCLLVSYIFYVLNALQMSLACCFIWLHLQLFLKDNEGFINEVCPFVWHSKGVKVRYQNILMVWCAYTTTSLSFVISFMLIPHVQLVGIHLVPTCCMSFGLMSSWVSGCVPQPNSQELHSANLFAMANKSPSWESDPICSVKKS
jgi:hypothetical protein